jgi:outer membrane biosynthesis protein TonB
MNATWGSAKFKIFFNRKGKVSSVLMLRSSGNRARDRQCVEWCRKQETNVADRGVKNIAQYFVMDIEPNAKLDRPHGAKTTEAPQA